MQDASAGDQTLSSLYCLNILLLNIDKIVDVEVSEGSPRVVLESLPRVMDIEH